jgi:hypothetical protein
MEGWGQALNPVGPVLPALLAVGLWTAWWLFAVNWKKAWPVLARGAWVPFALIAVVIAAAWSRIDESNLNVGGVTVPNVWWKAGAVALLVAGALLVGWLQGLLRWAPPEISVEPPAEHAGHGHGDHGHH